MKVIVVMKFEPKRIAMATGTTEYITNMLLGRWAYYLKCCEYYFKCLPELFGTHLLFIAALGVVSGMLVRRWRHETILILIMTVVCFTFFAYVPAKEGRYMLLLSVPIVIFCLLGLLSTAQCIGKLTEMRTEWVRAAILTAIAVLIISQAWAASKVSVLSISGFKQLVGFLEKIAPDEPVFYDGKDSGIFTFYLRAGDPNYRRRAVLGRKLLYAESMYYNTKEFISSPQEAVEVLQKSSGCQWVIVAYDHTDAQQIAAHRHLQEAVKGPEFELVQSFPIIRKWKTGVEERTNACIYRFLVPIERVDEVDMPFFSLGENVRIRIKPIQR